MIEVPPRPAHRPVGHRSDEAGLRVFVVDDHASYRRALATVVELTPGMIPVGAASSMREALATMPAARADLALIDIQLGDGSGIELTRRLVAAQPDLRVLLVSTMAEADLPADVATCGAVGFVRKDRFGPAALAEAAAHRHGIEPDAAAGD